MLSSYRLVEKLGEGGMGVVWKAMDVRLDREVAIKILPRSFAEDPERLGRFRREAKVLAQLNHTNIAAIYGFEETGGSHFLVLELAGGETLAERLESGPIPPEESLKICRQIAMALAVAHERGIVHRDLKPANVKLTANGEVKVLDFGLAKALEADSERKDIAHSPTVTRHMTKAGLILGTAGYMSPEQARGKPVDRRTDIWAFGCLLYECLTGELAFPGETITDSLAAILHKEPDWSTLPPALSPGVLKLFARCLQKDPNQRLHDISDARIEIEEILRHGDSHPSGYASIQTTAPGRPRPFRWPRAATWLLLFAAGIGAGVGALALLGSGGTSAGSAEVARFSIAPGLDVSFPLVSPDGSTVAYVVREDSRRGPTTRLFTRRLDQFEAIPVARSEGLAAHAFSPDGRWIAFVAPFSRDASGYKLAKVPTDGSSPPLTLADWPDEMGPGMVWLPDGTIAGIRGDPQQIVRFDADGGVPIAPVEIDSGEFKGDYIVVSALPGGTHLIAAAGYYGERGFQWSVAAIDTASGEAKIVVDNGTIAGWSPTGHLLFTRRDTLLAVPFDVDRVEATGGPVTLLGGLLTVNALVGGWFDLARNGTLVYQPGGVQGTNRRLAFVDADGRVSAWTQDRRSFDGRFTASPDGRRLAVSMSDAEGRNEIWVSEIDSPALERLDVGVDLDCRSPAWGPEGETLYYFCVGEGLAGGVYRARYDGAEAPRRLLPREEEGVLLDPGSVSADGRWLLVDRVAESRSLVAVPLTGAIEASPPVVLTHAEANERGARFSPDGEWIALVSDISGRDEVYVRPWKDGRAGRSIPISTIGGARPVWSKRSGELELVYETDAGRLIAVTLSPGSAGGELKPRTVLDLTRLRGDDMGIDRMPDGRFLIVQRGDEEDGGAVHIVLNWFGELEGKVATR